MIPRIVTALLISFMLAVPVWAQFGATFHITGRVNQVTFNRIYIQGDLGNMQAVTVNQSTVVGGRRFGVGSVQVNDRVDVTAGGFQNGAPVAHFINVLAIGVPFYGGPNQPPVIGNAPLILNNVTIGNTVTGNVAAVGPTRLDVINGIGQRQSVTVNQFTAVSGRRFNMSQLRMGDIVSITTGPFVNGYPVAHTIFVR